MAVFKSMFLITNIIGSNFEKLKIIKLKETLFRLIHFGLLVYRTTDSYKTVHIQKTCGPSLGAGRLAETFLNHQWYYILPYLRLLQLIIIFVAEESFQL